MGANPATQAFQIVNNVETVLSIELLNACQAMHFRQPFKSSIFLESIAKSFIKEVSFVKEDKFLHEDIVKSISFLQTVNIDNEVLFT